MRGPPCARCRGMSWLSPSSREALSFERTAFLYIEGAGQSAPFQPGVVSLSARHKEWPPSSEGHVGGRSWLVITSVKDSLSGSACRTPRVGWQGQAGSVPSCAVLCRPVPSCAVLCRPVPSCAVLCRPVPSCAVLCRPVPSCAVLCRPVPSCAVLCRPITLPSVL